MIRTARRARTRAMKTVDVSRCKDFQATDILRMNNDNSCDYKTGQTCVAKLTLAAKYFDPEPSNGANITYDWSTVDGHIHDSHTNETVVIWVTGSDANKEVEVTCAISNGTDTSIVKKTFKTHHRLIV